VNPLLFVPLAFSRTADGNLLYRAISIVSFLTISIALIWAAVLGPGF
jgi:hypothetical protein